MRSARGLAASRALEILKRLLGGGAAEEKVEVDWEGKLDGLEVEEGRRGLRSSTAELAVALPFLFPLVAAGCPPAFRLRPLLPLPLLDALVAAPPLDASAREAAGAELAHPESR